MNMLGQFIMELRWEHLVPAKHVLIHLRGIVEYGMRYLGDGEVKLLEYIEILGRYFIKHEENLKVFLYLGIGDDILF